MPINKKEIIDGFLNGSITSLQDYPEFTDDKEVVSAAVQNNGTNVQFASQRLRNDEDVGLLAVRQNGYSLYYLSGKLQNTRKIVLTAVRENGMSLIHASEKFKNDKQAANEAIRSNPYVYEYLPEKLKTNPEIIIVTAKSILRQEGKEVYGIEDITELINREDIKERMPSFEENVMNNRWDIEMALLDYEEEKETVIENFKSGKIKSIRDCLKFIDEEEIAKIAVEKDHHNYAHLSKRLQDNEEITIMAVKANGYNLSYASDRLKDNRDIVMAAINGEYFSLKYASERLRDDKEIALAAVKLNGHNLKYASERLQDDEEVVMVALKNTSKEFGPVDDLRYASERLRDNENIAIAAIQKHPSNFQYISDRLRDNRKVVEELLNQDKIGPNFQYVSERLKNDKDLGMTAIEKFPYSYNHLGKKLQNDPEIIITVAKIHAERINKYTKNTENETSITINGIDDIKEVIRWTGANMPEFEDAVQRNMKAIEETLQGEKSEHKEYDQDDAKIRALVDDAFNKAIAKTEENITEKNKDEGLVQE